MILDGLLRQGLAIRLAVLATQPSEVLGNSDARDFIDWDVVELGKYDFQNVGIHGNCGGAMGAIPHTEQEPHIFYKFPECHAWSLGFRFFDIRHGFFLLSLPLGLRFRSGRGCQLHFPQNRHPFRFLPTFGGSHPNGRLPCFTTKNLLAIVVSAKENLDLEETIFPFLSFS